MNKRVLMLSISAITANCYAIKDKPTVKKPKVIKKQESVHMNIITLPSGLRYEVIRESDKPATEAKTPRKGVPITVHYTGWFDDNGQKGSKFDSSRDRKDEFRFIIGIGQVIQGWDEGVMGMKAGEHRRLYIPSPLAYGAAGVPDRRQRGIYIIPQNANLIFDVELISVG